jgi:hypothetical protein
LEFEVWSFRLPDPGEIPDVDDRRASERQPHAGQLRDREEPGKRRGRLPGDAGNRLPQETDADQHQACNRHIDRPLEGRRDDARDPGSHRAASEQAVMSGKGDEQRDVPGNDGSVWRTRCDFAERNGVREEEIQQ